MSKFANSRITIGLLIDWANAPYHLDLIRGVREAVQKHNVNLIMYIGGAINAPMQFEVNRNIVYSLVDPFQVDGLVISAASLKRTCSIEELYEFCYRFRSYPLITIGHNVPGIHNVGTDNKTGMEELMHHLIHDHKYRKFAFLRGPEGNQDAEDRFNIYKEILEREEIEYRQDYVLKGNFMYEYAIRVFSELLDRGKPDCDVVVCANDDMAIGVLSILQAGGYNIPGDMAVVGFDNLDITQFLTIPLTTVSQQVRMQGFYATEQCISLVQGEKIDLSRLLPSCLIKRQSCGCLIFSRDNLYHEKNEIQGTDRVSVNAETFISGLKAIKYLQDTKDEKLFTGAVRGLITSVTNENPGNFFRELEKIFFLSESFTLTRHSISDLYYRIREFLISNFKEKKKRVFIDHFFPLAIARYSDQQNRNMQYRRVIDEREMDILLRTIENLVAIMDKENLEKLLAEVLPKIGIRNCYLCLYTNPESDNSLSVSRLMFTLPESGKINIGKAGILFPTKKLLPDNILSDERSFSLYVEPLFFGFTQLGFCLFEYISEGETTWYSARRIFVTIALKAAYYVHKVQLDFTRYEEEVTQRTKALSLANELLTKLYNARKKVEEEVRKLNEDLEKRVKERTFQLEEMNTQLRETLKQLKTTQAKLVQVEKMAALGNLVAGIAHEINTPVGIGVTAASHMESITNDIYDRYRAGTLKRSDLEYYLSMSKEASTLILSNLKRAYELICNFKKISVDQSTEENREIQLKTYLADILLSMKPRLKNTSHEIKIKCPDDLVIYSHPGAFYQIVTNLIMNSLIHGFESREQGKIIIHASIRNNRLFFRYYDNGAGIKKEDLKKIFNPFFTTKRSKGGSGLGLHLVYNIATQTLGGSIQCISRSGEGTLFKIIIPLTEKESNVNI
ncbi:MAG: substrate-binding domain-containing protein [Spirochaetales bacterium]|nr:substrate-binding domain-containing protein [Spirochaetales bacterium]